MPVKVLTADVSKAKVVNCLQPLEKKHVTERICKIPLQLLMNIKHEKGETNN